MIPRQGELILPKSLNEFNPAKLSIKEQTILIDPFAKPINELYPFLNDLQQKSLIGDRIMVMENNHNIYYVFTDFSGNFEESLYQAFKGNNEEINTDIGERIKALKRELTKRDIDYFDMSSQNKDYIRVRTLWVMSPLKTFKH